jgi:hypothetical protein
MIGPNSAPTLPVPRFLDGEQTRHDDERDRDDERLERGRGDLEPLDAREHGDRGRDEPSP